MIEIDHHHADPALSAAIHAQFLRLGESALFKANRRSCEFLQFLLDRELAGEGATLTGYAIGLDFFGRNDDFDPTHDSIVRVQGARLRKLLGQYYRDHPDDPIEITLPTGGYRLSFHDRAAGRVTPADQPGALSESAATDLGGNGAAGAGARHDGAPDEAPSAAAAATTPRRPWWHSSHVVIFVLLICAAAGLAIREARSDSLSPGTQAGLQPPVAMLPITLSATAPDVAGLAHEISDGLLALSRKGQYLPLRQVDEPTGFEVAVKGTLGAVSAKRFFSYEIINVGNGETLKSNLVPLEPSTGSGNLAKVGRLLELDILNAERQIAVARPSSDKDLWSLFLKATAVPGTVTNKPDWELQRIKVAQQALEIDPTFAPAHAVLADKYGYMSLYSKKMAESGGWDNAEKHARLALQYGPTRPEVIDNLARYRYHAGDLMWAKSLAQDNLRRQPLHYEARFQALAYAYACETVPPAVLKEVEAYVEQLGPKDPLFDSSTTWLGQLYWNNNDLTQAMVAAANAISDNFNIDPGLRLAAILQAMGRSDRAYEVFNAVRQNWPDLDIAFIAANSIPRRCGGGSQTARIRKAYADLAINVANHDAKAKVAAAAP